MTDKILAAQNAKYKNLAIDGIDDYEAVLACRDFLGDQSRKKVLDIACGDGSFLANYLGTSEKYGIEISDLADNPRLGVKITQGDIEKGLPYESEQFDAISAQMIIEHLVDTDGFLEECYRILRKDGTLVLSTPNLASPRVIFRLIFGIQPDVISYSLYDGCRHMRYYTYGSLRSQLEQKGFRVVNRHGAIGFRNLVRYLPKRFRMFLFKCLPGLGGEIVVKAVKTDHKISS
jgi:SAM-dependent methyltransferase